MWRGRPSKAGCRTPDAPPAVASIHFVVPGAMATRTGGYEYDRRIIAGLGRLGWRVRVHELDASFPCPTEAARAEAGAVFRGLEDRAVVVVDGLALGALPDLAHAEASRLAIVALVHHPLARETGLDPSYQEALFRSERRALAAVRAVVVTSPATAAVLREYGVPGARVHVVEPGTDPAPVARGSNTPAVSLLTVASVTPRKGHEQLVDALALLRHLPWTLTCVGSCDRDPAHAARVRARVHEAALQTRVTFAGEVGDREMSAQYDRADVFVLPTWYEGYGMAVAEALAHGLPVVATATGAIPALVTGGSGVVVPPGDTGALSRALAGVLSDSRQRAAMAAAARRVRLMLPAWPAQTGRLAGILEQVADGRL